jgi:TM2 domain-containing membrane protein YozV
MDQSNYCPSCGFENRSNAKFCKQCGAVMTAAQPPLPPVQQSWPPAPQPIAPPLPQSAAGAATAWLVAPATGQRYPLSANATLGRVAGNAVVLPDASISSQHAVITESGGQWQISDNSSRNGTWINRVRLAAPHVLRSGDEVMLGTLALRFETNQALMSGAGGMTLIDPAQFPAPTGSAGSLSMQGNSRNKIIAGMLAILLGGIGAHKFYLGQYAQGVLYLLLCWTVIPEILGLIEGLIYLGMSDASFAQKYG